MVVVPLGSSVDYTSALILSIIYVLISPNPGSKNYIVKRSRRIVNDLCMWLSYMGIKTYKI